MIRAAREQGRDPTSEDEDSSAAVDVETNAKLADINEALAVEEIDDNLFRSKALWKPARARGVFGGNVIAQSVAAANKTVAHDFKLHSFHCYFLLAGDQTVPIIYHVSRVRDGGSYVTRSVNANQRGRCIFTMILSYQKPEPQQPRFALEATNFSPSPDYQVRQNIVRQPEDCPTNEERYQALLRRPSIDPKFKYIIEGWVEDRKKSPVELRDALPDMYDEDGRPNPGSHQAFWFKTRKPMFGGPEAQKIALSYSSDFFLLSTISKALNNSSSVKMMASLDHSVWFYDEFDASDWLLYIMQAQAASNGRGVTMGRIYRRDGTLVAVVSQEGVVRSKVAGEERRVKRAASKL